MKKRFRATRCRLGLWIFGRLRLHRSTLPGISNCAIVWCGETHIRRGLPLSGRSIFKSSTSGEG